MIDMAERQRVRADAAGAADQPPLTAAEAGRFGLRQIGELTGKEPEGVTGVEPTDDGWLVTVEVVEDRRIPSTTDLLATYETEMGLDGELISYRRVRRYARGRADVYRDDA
jgi:Gas vesicle synthesis protein GvpO